MAQADNREDLLTRVASLYYEYDYSQEEIARKVKTSRSNVSRLLKEAKQKGLVEIRIHRRIPTAPEMEQEFKRRFGLDQAMIVDDRESDYTERLAAVGQLAAWYLEEILRKDTLLAISWGTGVASAVNAMSHKPELHIDVVQMIGSFGTVVSEIDGPELARRLADKLGGGYYYLHAPLFVDSSTTRDALLDQPTIADVLDRARTAQVALVGIGTTEPEASSFLRSGHLTREQLDNLREQGAIGETSGKHFAIDGSFDFDINNRVIAMDMEDLKRIPHVVAVACGLPKRLSILGVLRGGYVNALATDSITAAAILEEASKT
ncbi:MAG: sugar-binding transcriptional regulator [Anaerolineaceae bacterium]|nr:sugar-binding transcriptional regulator [Anaerolineaceae bacterium]